MKKQYIHPELEVTKLTSEDILNTSPNEVEIDGGNLFS